MRANATAVAEVPAEVVLEETEFRTTMKPRKEPPRDPLKRVGKPFYGAYLDLKKRIPYYLSDITDGLSSKVLSSTLFIFFACVSPAVTFGGIYSELLPFVGWHVL